MKFSNSIVIKWAIVFLALFGAQAFAVASQKIVIDFYPYTSSLGSNAVVVETELVKEAIKVCGKLENVARLDHVNLKMPETTADNINPNGTAGAPIFQAILIFSYPRVTGTAEVICK